jgi:hypothetical protein
MEHPLIGDISGLTPEELTDKINELHRKLGIAQRIGNGYLGHQIRMAIETYQNQYRSKLADLQKNQPQNNFDNIINIE